MQRTTLGQSGIEVSLFCLGTMTYGSQTPEDDAHRQIDRAVERGCTFLDTAEMYPVNPVREETVGRSEEIIGNWIARSGRRDAIEIATKCSGLNDRFVRKGLPVTADTITQACDSSLKRLQTDVIDLYQLHWPNRGSFHFRQIWDYDPAGTPTAEVRQNLADVMGALGQLRDAGKIRAFGLSNESTWGTMEWLRAAEATGGPRIAGIQNEYSLLCRQYDSDLGEMGYRENIPLLAFSPLACGLLTGKYQGGAVPEGSRRSLSGALGGRITDRVWPAIDAYLAIARAHALDPVHMALAWCLSRPFPVIPIFGATRFDQLDTALDAADVTLSAEVLDEISATHRAHPAPY